MNDKDSDLIFEAYKDSVLLNQENFLKTLAGKFGARKKEPAQESPPREMIPLKIGGRPTEIDKYDLIYKSKTMYTIGDDPDNNIEFKIHKAKPPFGGSSHELDNMPEFIPLVVVNRDDYPRPATIIAKMGQARPRKEQAMQDLREFMAEYRGADEAPTPKPIPLSRYEAPKPKAIPPHSIRGL